jgi:UDP:flavonoid glycosyltransferase YjiC (YdhE family)
MSSKHIVIATFGSLGDLHPYLALGIGLQVRGHRVTIATSPIYRPKVESEGIGYAHVRPDLSPDNTEMLRLVMDARNGSEHVIRHVVLPHLRDSYDDLMRAAEGADLILTHPITYAGPLVAQKTGLRWASSVLAPISFLSDHDPSVLAPAPWLAKLYPLGVAGLINKLGKAAAKSWAEPIQALRTELGLPRGANPIFEGQHSPSLVLALFSQLLAKPQPDWPPNTRVTGFAFYDRLEKTQGLPADVARFLDAGPPPIVFTLGSSAVMTAGDFYRESAVAAGLLGRRAVLLIGPDPRNAPSAPLPQGVIAAVYAPYSEIFPRAAAIVHQGGAGTTAQALRSGRPMLFVPFAHDQHDNAARVIRLGIARQVSRKAYRAAKVAKELGLLLDGDGNAARAADVGRKIQAEDGVAAACEALEGLL